MSLYEMTPEGRAVLICQVCKNRCHSSGPKEVYQDSGGGNYRIMECPVCCCHECVQLADDPIRRKIAPRMLEQTRARPFSIEHAMKGLGEALGLRAPAPQRRIGRKEYCSCGGTAKSRCISCDEPLCGKCLERHRCQA